MTTAELLKLHKETCDKCYGIVQKKNNDYSGGATSPDALANFKMSTALGLSPVMGLLLRIQDKMMRIKTFDTDGALGVADESVNDAFEDIINYAILGKALMKERKAGVPKAKQKPTDERIRQKIEQVVAEETTNTERQIPISAVYAAIDLFTTGFVYFGDVDRFTAAANKYALHIPEEELNDSIQICEIQSSEIGESYVLVAVKKDSRLYVALGGGGKQPIA